MTANGDSSNPTRARATHETQRPPSPPSNDASERRGTWTAEEHDRFLLGMAQFPLGPWSAVAEVVGTRSVRQVHSHAQKYAAKVTRHQQGLGKKVRLTDPRESGDATNACGHRVEPQIPGTFMNRVTRLPRRRRLDVSFATESSGSSLRLAMAREQEGPVPGQPPARQCWPIDVDARGPVSPACVAGLRLPQESESLDLNDDASDSLPSLSESLDFFIRQFDALPPSA